ncbi:Rha family transcriptional regulator [Clostridium estertheticum]|uniref:Rha family transcriptional regulator n=1 Tax=Clostridium estertheticum TaxID=238834 RepID=UPI001C0B9394|nr:Rha family transcriptional regulator [Clostridium estertheticum]MBU3200307.1 Rha family transcriptional regulator [Clostridium estertheticum]WAG64478.1 Rha family transcriptional regulator [Clostridium estertheticum]
MINIININGQLVTDSRDVAVMIDKKHSELFKTIRGYIEILEQSANLQSIDFFILATYLNRQNKEQPYYQLTKIGCDMISTKITGTKKKLFVVEYSTNFSEMQKTLNPACVEDILIQSLLEIKKARLQLAEDNNDIALL